MFATMTLRVSILGGMAAFLMAVPLHAELRTDGASLPIETPLSSHAAPLQPLLPAADLVGADLADNVAASASERGEIDADTGWPGAMPHSRPFRLVSASPDPVAPMPGSLVSFEAQAHRLPLIRSGLAPVQALRPPVRPSIVIPKARWDHRPEGHLWTMAGLRAMARHGQRITEVVPRDIDAWCPGYRDASTGERRAFWVGFLSALAFHESTWRPDAVGGGGLWYGLLQIYPQTARHFRCRAQTGEALKDGAANVSCAIRILNHTIPRDRAIALRDVRWRGVAADWGPMRDDADVAQMKRWTRAQPYCRASAAPQRSLRPLLRPASSPRVALQ